MKNELPEIIEIPFKYIFYVLMVIVTLISVLLDQNYITARKAQSFSQKTQHEQQAEKETRAKTEEKILNTMKELKNKSGYDYAIYDSKFGRLYSYYVETIDNDNYFVENASATIDSYFSQNKFYKVNGILPEVSKKLIARFNLPSMSALTFDFSQEIDKKNGTYQSDQIVLVENNEYLVKLLSLNYKNGWPQFNDDTYILARTTRKNGECRLDQPDKLLIYFSTKSSYYPECSFQLWVFDVNFELTTYAEWNADRLIFANYNAGDHLPAEKLDTINKLKSDNFIEVLDDMGEIASATEAERFLNTYLNLTASLPEDGKYTYSNDSQGVSLEMTVKNLRVMFLGYVNDYNLCEFSGGENTPEPCDVSEWYRTKNYLFEQYNYNGRIQSIKGTYLKNNRKSEIFVLPLDDSDNGIIDSAEKAYLKTIFDTVVYEE